MSKFAFVGVGTTDVLGNKFHTVTFKVDDKPVAITIDDVTVRNQNPETMIEILADELVAVFNAVEDAEAEATVAEQSQEPPADPPAQTGTEPPVQ